MSTDYCIAMFDNYFLCQTHEDDVVFRTNDLRGALLGRLQRFVARTNAFLAGTRGLLDLRVHIGVLVGALLGRLHRFVDMTSALLGGTGGLLGLRIRSIGVRVVIALATLKSRGHGDDGNKNILSHCDYPR